MMIEGRVLAVTGAGSGIGAELAVTAARRGVRAVAVIDIDAASGRVILGSEEDLLCEEFTVNRVNWHGEAPAEPRKQ